MTKWKKKKHAEKAKKWERRQKKRKRRKGAKIARYYLVKGWDQFYTFRINSWKHFLLFKHFCTLSWGAYSTKFPFIFSMKYIYYCCLCFMTNNQKETIYQRLLSLKGCLFLSSGGAVIYPFSCNLSIIRGRLAQPVEIQRLDREEMGREWVNGKRVRKWRKRGNGEKMRKLK